MYDRYYQEFCNEVHKIFSCYLFWRMLNNRIAEDKKLLSALNRTPLSWMNGRKPVLKRREPSLDFYESDFGKLLDNVKNT